MSKAQPQTPSGDLLGDLGDPLAIEAPPREISSHQRGLTEEEGVPGEVDGTAIVPVGEQANTVEVFFALFPLLSFT